MDRDNEVKRSRGFFRRKRAGGAGVAEPVTPVETLLASTEYEIGQLRRSFEQVQLATRPKPVAQLPFGPVNKAAFEGKLRNPESRKRAEWWAALGLDS